MTAASCHVWGLAELLLPEILAWLLCFDRFSYRSMSTCWYGPRCSVTCADSSPGLCFRPTLSVTEQNYTTYCLIVFSLSYIGTSLWLQPTVIVNLCFILFVCFTDSVLGTCVSVVPSPFAVVRRLGVMVWQCYRLRFLTVSVVTWPLPVSQDSGFTSILDWCCSVPCGVLNIGSTCLISCERWGNWNRVPVKIIYLFEIPKFQYGCLWW